MKDIISKINESKKCPYCDIHNKELSMIGEYGKELPNHQEDCYYGIEYAEWGDEYSKKHILINTGRRGGWYRPKYCPECGRKLE